MLGKMMLAGAAVGGTEQAIQSWREKAQQKREETLVKLRGSIDRENAEFAYNLEKGAWKDQESIKDPQGNLLGQWQVNQHTGKREYVGARGSGKGSGKDDSLDNVTKWNQDRIDWINENIGLVPEAEKAALIAELNARYKIVDNLLGTPIRGENRGGTFNPEAIANGVALGKEDEALEFFRSVLTDEQYNQVEAILNKRVEERTIKPDSFKTSEGEGGGSGNVFGRTRDNVTGLLDMGADDAAQFTPWWVKMITNK